MTRTDKTLYFLEQGLESWVQQYNACISYGNLKTANEIKQNIEQEIFTKGLDRSLIFA